VDTQALLLIAGRSNRAAAQKEAEMYAITGISGKVGGAVARTLLAAGQPVRAVVRDAAKARSWAQQGCEVAVAEMGDAAALASAFREIEGVFILPPPVFDPAPGFPEARAVATAVRTALEAARPAKVVSLSTVGAQATQPNLLTQHTLMEQSLRQLTIPVTLLRPAWFMENLAWDVASARDTGVIASFLQPLDKPVAMIATADIGRVAAELIQQDWKGCRVVELEAARRSTPNEVAATFAGILGRPVAVAAVPRQTWASLFESQGMNNPTPRIQMLDGFNEGWIAFEAAEADTIKGEVSLETVLRQLIEAGA
jgi:NAD(P)H dehydrogenase (quinone)